MKVCEFQGRSFGMITNYPTQRELEECFEIKVDERNGHETLWRKFLLTNQFGNKGEWVKVNCKANTSEGYCHVRFKGRLVLYHTIVFILVNGDMPEDSMIDHISGDRIDNQTDNLRLSTHRDNNGNKEVHPIKKVINQQEWRWFQREGFDYCLIDPQSGEFVSNEGVLLYLHEEKAEEWKAKGYTAVKVGRYLANDKPVITYYL